MNNFWLLDPTSRLKAFRQFRLDLIEISDLEQRLQFMVDWWKDLPMSTRVIDPYTPDQWPTPWEIIHENNYDENALALIYFHMLKVLDYESKLYLVEDEEKTFIKLIILVDDKHIINYSYGNVDNKETIKKCKILESWENYSILD